MSRLLHINVTAVIAMTVVWTMLWGSVSPMIVLGGILLAIIVMKVFPFPPVEISGNLRPLPFLVLLGRFLFDLVLASFQVAWVAIRPQAVPQSALIEVHLVSESELLQTITAELISLVPGSLLIELDSEGKRLWLHVLNAASPELIDAARAKARAQEHRLLAAVGSREEYDASTQKLRELTA